MVESNSTCNDVNDSTDCNYNYNNANGLKFWQEIDTKILKWEESDNTSVFNSHQLSEYQDKLIIDPDNNF